MMKRIFLPLFLLLPILSLAASIIVPAPPQLDSKSYVLMDANSGKIIAEKNEDERLPPASLTKLMTLYITFKELVSGQLHLDDKVRVSKKAWQTEGSRMFLKVGSEVTINDLLQGIIVASGNDATTAIAEHIGGSESVFVQMMNQQAKALGMDDSHFTDATGLPHPDHYASADDFAILARAIINTFPQYYHYFSEKWFTWNKIKQPNRNRLLWRSIGVDGLKTGHTKAAGYCLVSSAKQNGMRLISVIMGTPSERDRINESQALLTYGFRFFTTKAIQPANTPLEHARIWGGEFKTIPVGFANNFSVTIAKANRKTLSTDLKIEKNLKAPINKGQIVGKMVVKLGDQILEEHPVIALQADPQGSLWRRFYDWVAHFFA